MGQLTSPFRRKVKITYTQKISEAYRPQAATFQNNFSNYAEAFFSLKAISDALENTNLSKVNVVIFDDSTFPELQAYGALHDRNGVGSAGVASNAYGKDMGFWRDQDNIYVNIEALSSMRAFYKTEIPIGYTVVGNSSTDSNMWIVKNNATNVTSNYPKYELFSARSIVNEFVHSINEQNNLSISDSTSHAIAGTSVTRTNHQINDILSNIGQADFEQSIGGVRRLSFNASGDEELALGYSDLQALGINTTNSSFIADRVANYATYDLTGNLNYTSFGWSGARDGLLQFNDDNSFWRLLGGTEGYVPIGGKPKYSAYESVSKGYMHLVDIVRENYNGISKEEAEEIISKQDLYGGIGSVIGASLGNYLGDGNAVKGIIYSSVLATAFQDVGRAIAGGPNIAIDRTETVVEAAKARFSSQVLTQIQGQAIGTLSSIFASQLSQSLGLEGFGGELFSTTAGTVIDKVLLNLTDAASANTGAFSGVFENGKFTGGDMLGNAIGSFIGAKLGSMLVKPETEAAVVLSSIGSAIGPIIAGKLIGNIVGNVVGKLGAILVPGIGAFVGFVLGALIGNLFGHKKPKVPSASAETALQLPFARYELGAATSANGGNLDMAQSMAANARDILNGLIVQITHGDDKTYVSNVSGATTTQAYGHTGSQLYVKINGVTHNVSSADDAVEYGALTAIRNTKVVGGDLFLKRAVLSSAANNLLSFSGDLQTADDYAFYSINRELINGYIADAFPVSTLSSVDQAFYDITANKAIVDKLALGQTLTSAENTTYLANKAQFDRASVIIQAKKDQAFYDGANKVIVDKILAEGPSASYTTSETTTYNGNKVQIDRIADAISSGRFSTLITADQTYYSGANKPLIDKVAAYSLNPTELAIYNANKAQFDRVLSMIGAQAIANPWMVTLLRASELKLDQFATSDFYGGLGGFLNSLGVSHGSGAYYENSTFRISGAAAGVVSVATPNTTTGVFDVLAQAMRSPDGNDIRDGHFDNLATLWQSTYSTPVAWTGAVNKDGFWGNGNDVFYVNMNNSPAATVAGKYSEKIASQAGATYEASIYAAQWRGLAEAYIEYLDADGNHLSWVTLTGTPKENGGQAGLLTNFGLLSATSEAPVGTAYRRLQIKLRTNAGTNPYAFFTRPESHEVIAGVTPDLNWEETGHSVYIDQMSKVGYSTTGAITSGNDIIDKSGSIAAVTIDDTLTTQIWIPTQVVGGGYTVPGHYQPITYTGGDDIFIGGQGADTLYGRGGWDWLDGGAGNDLIYGGDNNDILIGGAGNDTLYGDAGDDYLAGGAGDDALWGGAGNDTLVDGTNVNSSEWLYGEDGDDTFLIANDLRTNYFYGGTSSSSSDPNGRDTMSAERLDRGIRFEMDYRPPDWTTQDAALRYAVVYDLATGAFLSKEVILSIENGTGSEFNDQIIGSAGANTLKGLSGADYLSGMDGNDILEGGAGADQLLGGNGSDTLSYEGSSEGVYVNLTTLEALGGDAEGDTWSSMENLRGSKLSDELKGTATQNTIQGLAGDDWIIATASGTVTQTYTTVYNPYLDEPITVPTGWTGGDIYDGGIGADTVDYSEATAGITANLGSYSLSSGTPGSGSAGMAQGHIYIGIENIVGTAYVDNLSAGAGAHTFEGGKGNDLLSGGAGADVYLFSRGDGSDTITETNADNNVLSFAGDIKYSDLYISSSGGSSGFLDVGIRGTTTDKVRVTSNFATLGNNKLKTVDMAGASQLDISLITFQPGGGTDNADTVNGGGNADWIFAFNGNDTITGSGTATEYNGNIIIGGLGNDTIKTSMGDDQFAYDRGDGIDTITDTGGDDTIVFGPTVKADDVIYQVVGNDLYIGLKDKTDAAKTASQVADRIRVVNGGVVTSGVLNTVEFVLAGGTSIDLRKLGIAWTGGENWSYSNVAPIALDLNGDGLNLTAVDDSTVIAQTAQGGVSRVGWVGPADGFLAVDRDGDGAINKLSEISFLQDKEGATSDLEGLATWDTNGDGLVDKNDANFDKILLWVDANQNGRSTQGELRTLTEAGISAIDLNGVATGYTAESGIDSYVQNTMKFIWADGSQGDAYDVALARHVLGSEGLAGGSYQAEWGDRDEDGTLGRLLNDPETAARAALIQSRKVQLDAISASYDEVKAHAQLDFSDNDLIDAKIAARWEEMDNSEQAAWLSGQATEVDSHIRAMTAEQGVQATLMAAGDATDTLIDTGYAQANTSVTQDNGLGQDGSQIGGSTSRTGGPAGPAGFAASLAAGAPDISGGPVDDGSVATDTSAAWWQGDGLSSYDSSSQSLASLLADMDGDASLSAGYGRPDDSAFAQQQLLLRQAVAGFASDTGGSAAVWDHTAVPDTLLAAASAAQKSAQNASAALLLPA